MYVCDENMNQLCIIAVCISELNVNRNGSLASLHADLLLVQCTLLNVMVM